MAKKFLDEQGLTTLWGLVKEQVQGAKDYTDTKTNGIVISDSTFSAGNQIVTTVNGSKKIQSSNKSIVTSITGSANVPTDGAVKTYVDDKVSDIEDSFENGGVKNPYALTFVNGFGSTNQVTYDGSEAKEINLNPHTLGTVERLKRITNDDNSSTVTVLENSGSSFTIKTTNSSGATETTFMVDKDGAYINSEEIAVQPWVENNFPKLDSNNLIPASYLPSYVDDVIEYSSKTAFPSTGEAGKIYVALDTNIVYRWGGSNYVEISSSLALGETSSTAYAGDKGKTNATNIATLQGYFTNGVAKQASKVTNKINFNDSGTADASGTNYDGSSAVIVSYNTIGAVNSKSVNNAYQAVIENSNATFKVTASMSNGTQATAFKIVPGGTATINDSQIIDESMALTEAEIQAICV